MSTANKPGENRRTASSDELRTLERMATEMREDLVQRILPFWRRLRDEERGGFYGGADERGQALTEHPRSLVLMSRILWTFSEAALALETPEALDDAAHIAAYLRRHMATGDGGAYWCVTADGEVSDARQITYGLSFYLYAWATYALALRALRPQDEEAARLAEAEADACYAFIRDRCWNGEYMAESAAPTGVDEDGRFVTGFTDQPDESFSMNTHLHILESLTRYLLMRPDPEVEQLLLHVVTVCRHRIYARDRAQLDLYIAPDGRRLTDIASFGHDIEYSWLLVESMEILAEQTARPDRYVALQHAAETDSLAIARAVLAHGRNPDGSVADAGYPDRIVHAHTVWWTQAEAIVGFLHAWQLSGETAFLEASRRVWDYVQAQMLDPSGEWLGVGRDHEAPRRNPRLADEWKCPYHNGRAAIEVLRRSRAMQAASAQA